MSAPVQFRFVLVHPSSAATSTASQNPADALDKNLSPPEFTLDAGSTPSDAQSTDTRIAITSNYSDDLTRMYLRDTPRATASVVARQVRAIAARLKLDTEVGKEGITDETGGEHLSANTNETRHQGQSVLHEGAQVGSRCFLLEELSQSDTSELDISKIRLDPSWDEDRPSDMMSVIRPLLEHKTTLIKGWYQLRHRMSNPTHGPGDGVGVGVGSEEASGTRGGSGSGLNRRTRRELARLAKKKQLNSSVHVSVDDLTFSAARYLAKYTLYYGDFMDRCGKKFSDTGKIQHALKYGLISSFHQVNKRDPMYGTLLDDTQSSNIALSLRGMESRQRMLDCAALAELSEGVVDLLQCYNDSVEVIKRLHAGARAGAGADKGEGLPVVPLKTYEESHNRFKDMYTTFRDRTAVTERSLAELCERTEQDLDGIKIANYRSLAHQVIALSMGYGGIEEYVLALEREARMNMSKQAKKERKARNKAIRQLLASEAARHGKGAKCHASR